MVGHEAVTGRRYPATPEDQRSSYEIVCKCGLVLVSYTWDGALDDYLNHVDSLVLVSA